MSKWPKAFHKHLRETQENEVVGVGDAVCMRGSALVAIKLLQLRSTATPQYNFVKKPYYWIGFYDFSFPPHR